MLKKRLNCECCLFDGFEEYLKLKTYCIYSANSEIDKLRKSSAVELQRLSAELRKAEIKISSLDLSVQQKVSFILCAWFEKFNEKVSLIYYFYFKGPGKLAAHQPARRFATKSKTERFIILILRNICILKKWALTEKIKIIF